MRKKILAILLVISLLSCLAQSLANVQMNYIADEKPPIITIVHPS